MFSSLDQTVSDFWNTCFIRKVPVTNEVLDIFMFVSFNSQRMFIFCYLNYENSFHMILFIFLLKKKFGYVEIFLNLLNFLSWIIYIFLLFSAVCECWEKKFYSQNDRARKNKWKRCFQKFTVQINISESFHNFKW